MKVGPQPRYRLYTGPGLYRRFFTDLLSGRLRRGDHVERFEEAVARWVGASSAVAMPRGRVGICLALRALIQPGQRVICSPYTIADVINMILAAGGEPVFADVERETCNIDPAEVEALLDERTGAVLVTHLHGLACPIEEIAALCRARGVPLIEDAAQALGTRVGGRLVGSFGDAGVFSFGMYKNLTTFYGGMVVTSDPDVGARVAEAAHGWPHEDSLELIKKVLQGLRTDVATWPPLFKPLVFRLFRFGLLHDVRAINRMVNSELSLERVDELPDAYLRRMTAAQARLGLARFEGVEAANRERIGYARLYHDGLADLPDVVLPPLRSDGSHAYTYFAIQHPRRDDLLKWLMRHGRDAGAQHLKNCADLPSFSAFARDCPRAREVAGQVVLLPTYPRYGEDEVRRTIAAVRGFCAGG